MFRLIVTVACLLIIGDYTLKLRRRYLEHRQLRWWRSRIVQLDSSEVVAPKQGGADSTESHPASAGFNWPGAIFMAVVVGGALFALWLARQPH